MGHLFIYLPVGISNFQPNIAERKDFWLNIDLSTSCDT